MTTYVVKYVVVCVVQNEKRKTHPSMLWNTVSQLTRSINQQARLVYEKKNLPLLGDSVLVVPK